MICYCCNKQKSQLHPFKSALLSNMVLLLCQSCIDSKLEPRWVVILAGRQRGFEYIKDFIEKRRYAGKEITATELVV
jgi:hypothetical protein